MFSGKGESVLGLHDRIASLWQCRIEKSHPTFIYFYIFRCYYHDKVWELELYRSHLAFRTLKMLGVQSKNSVEI